MVKGISQLDPWTCSYGKLKAAELVEVPQQDKWRLPYLCSLLAQRREAYVQAMEADEKRIEELIESLVTN